MPTPQHRSWGRQFAFQHEERALHWRQDTLPASQSILPYGMGRSYGDSCLNEHGTLLHCRGLDHFIAFDEGTGLLHCEAGVTLEAILQFAVPRGWFLPVTPGTQFVTVGGAIANDVHGKNHNTVGTFGCHVRQLTLLRSDGVLRRCAMDEHPALFAATVGGLGLTGVIVDATVQLIPVQNAFIQEESIQCGNLDEMLALFTESEGQYQYTVAWIDCLAQPPHLGRGIFTRGNHCTDTSLPRWHTPRRKLTVPVVFPPGCLNRWSVQAFNAVYFNKLGGKRKATRMDYDRFFYPLDAVLHWNRLYGPRGFLQYQCVLVDDARDGMKALLQRIARSGQPSPLNVLKEFGSTPSPGLLSFPRKGLTLALDFPFRGDKTLALCNELDEIVRQCNGALYPAKDSRMSPAMFAFSYPQLPMFHQQVDPVFSSSFWRRVTGDTATAHRESA